jgi:DNA topoisomerase-3
MKAGMKALLEKLRQNFAVQIAALNLEQLVLGNRYFNDTKVTDHHAIIPTLVLPGSLSADEHKVYTAIVLRFIASFYPPCIKQITTVLAEAAQLGFKTTGTVIESAGWQVLFQDEPKAVAAGDSARPLPRFVEGETGAHTPAIKAGKTTPPKPYNEASLLAMMESAGKTCGDEALKAALKEKGLGTPATRAAIIEVLIKRNYIHRQKKLLLSTESGRQLIALIHDERLKSAAMTGEWEAKLKQMEQQRYDPEQFMAEIGQFTRALITTAAVPVLDGKDLGLCPLCQHPIIEGRQGYGCSAWKSGCRFVLWKQAYGLTVSRAMAAQLLQSGVSQQAYGLKIDGQSVYAKLSLNGQGELAYQPQAAPALPPDSTVLADCPLCNGKIVETAKAYSCSEWRNGCKVVIWKTIAHKKITSAMAIKLLKTGETAELKGFKSAKGTIFSARLKLVEGKVTFTFGGQ